MPANPFPFNGLSDAEVATARQAHGTNVLEAPSSGGLWKALLKMVTEPMFLLLLVAATIYFLLGELSEAFFMLGAIVLISTISLYQEQRRRRALEALQAFTHPVARTIRNDQVVELPTADLVVGDHVVVSEGELVPADGEVVQANDFAVNESILTGEAFSVTKEVSADKAGRVYRGTQAVGGLAVVRITAVGPATEIGRIGSSVAGMQDVRSPLERQIQRFVRQMAIVGAIFFLIVWGLNFLSSHSWLDSLLKGLTLAMSILPEEIPVAFTTFMALGAWRMMRLGVLVKDARTVETLGAATVICTDKTGTITENRMELVAVRPPGMAAPLPAGQWTGAEARKLITTAMWASEPVPFDPMEIALHAAYASLPGEDRRPTFRMVHEYPLGGKPPMMTHVFANDMGERIIAAKGAPEAILACSDLDDAGRSAVMAEVEAFAGQGYRLLAVGEARWTGEEWPAEQQHFTFHYLGLVAFHDPPKKNIASVFASFREAGIRTFIITGDNAITATAIARQVGFRISGEPVNGEAVQGMDEETLGRMVRERNLFTRMFPEAKLRVVKALKAQGEVVAMTGDGVNDGPALKAAHIGIAMGRRGSELAKEAAALVLLDDDLGHMVDAVAQGRRIYGNLKKAIRYIISIHIPIILTVALPLMLGWLYPNLFTPVHVIFLELLMGPTCSIAYESEPLESGSMKCPPRRMDQTFLSWTELRTSLAQGLVITVAMLGCYQLALQQQLGEEGTRTFVFTALVVANIGLTLVNRSFEHSVWRTLRYPNPLLAAILGGTVAILLLLLYVPLFRDFFQLITPDLGLLVTAVLMGMASVLWYEGVKAWKRKKASVPPKWAV
ncbi:MAG TPA: cation-translocating P-type ATPase [Flavobacteriales bacterium]|nr:cation-translocating P-type ATPase [Flavobacteriales bacterium]